MLHLAALLFFSISPSVSSAAAPPPPVYVDKGACPRECCSYRRWAVLKDTNLVNAVDGKTTVGRVTKGMRVQAVTGEVHTVPLKVKTHEGKEIFLLTYQGEGTWTVWQDGVVQTDVNQDWESDKTPTSTWWTQIKLANGTTGWTKERDSFEDPLGCDSESPTRISDETETSSGCDLATVGISNKDAFIKFFNTLKTNVAAGDQNAIAKQILFPLNVNGDNDRFIVKNADEFKKRYKSIFTETAVKAISEQQLDTLFCRDQGVMFGSGAVWVSSRKGTIGIISVNP